MRTIYSTVSPARSIITKKASKRLKEKYPTIIQWSAFHAHPIYPSRHWPCKMDFFHWSFFRLEQSSKGTASHCQLCFYKEIVKWWQFPREKITTRSLHTPRSDRSCSKGCGWALWALTLCEQEECLTRALRSDGLFLVFRVVMSNSVL